MMMSRMDWLLVIRNTFEEIESGGKAKVSELVTKLVEKQRVKLSY